MADQNDNININVGINPIGAETGGRRARSAVKGVSDEGAALAAMYKRMQSAIDPAYAAQEKYNRALEEHRRLFAAGVISGQEFAAANRAAAVSLNESRTAVERNSAAYKEAAAIKKAEAAASAQAVAQAAATEKAANASAAAEAKLLAQEVAAAKKAAIAQEKADNAAAAAEAKRLAQETATVQKAQAAETAAAIKAAKTAEKAAAKDAAEAAKLASKQKLEAERASTAASREAAEATRRQAIEERSLAKAEQELRASIDPAYAAQIRYNQTMAAATRLLLDNKLKTGEWIAIQKQARIQQDINTRSLGRQNTGYVQIGYQLQDVVASYASGISPLVILAQQGGQTASAITQMGGKFAGVAGFIAGPWGAIILGAIVLFGLLSNSSKKAKEDTVDLMDAESRRKASVEKLSEALKEFNKQQKEANTNEEESLRLKNEMNDQETVSSRGELLKAQQELSQLKERLAAASRNAGETGGQGTENVGAILYLTYQINQAQKKVDNLKERIGDLGKGDVELSITQSLRDAEGLADKATAARQAYQEVESRITDIQRRQLTYVQAHYTGEKLIAEQNRINLSATKAIADKKEKLATLEKRISEEAKNQNAEYGKGVAIFKSREQAIGIAGKELIQQGFSVKENNQFGGITGNHPGMGNAAHGKYAADVSLTPGSDINDPAIKAQTDATVRAYQSRGYRALWNGAVYEPFQNGPGKKIPTGTNQHTDHVHLEAPASIVGKPTQAGFGKEIANQLNDQETAEKAARKDALDSLVADLEYKQTLAENDYQEQLRLQGEKIAALKKFYGDESREAINAQRQEQAMVNRHNQQLLSMEKARIAAQSELRQNELEAQRNEREIGRGIGGDTLQTAVQVGLINPRQELEAKRAILAEQYQDQVNYEEAIYQLKLKALNDQLALLPKESEAFASLKLQMESLEAQHNITMRSLSAQNARDINRINLDSIQATNARWHQITDSISQSFSTMFQNIWTHSGSFKQDLLNMADQLVFKFVDAGLKIASDWAANELQKTAVSLFGNHARTAATIAAEGTQTAAKAAAAGTQTGIAATQAGTEATIIAATTGAAVTGEAIKTSAKVAGGIADKAVTVGSATTELGARAATSAAGAYSSTVVIPFIGPVAAPVAAAVALAAVLGFGALISAKGGMGEVPSDQLAMVHKKEMILPAWIAEPMRKSLAAPSSSGLMGAIGASGADARQATHMSGGGDTIFKYMPQHTNMGAGFEELLRRDGASLRKWIRNEVRNGKMKVS